MEVELITSNIAEGIEGLVSVCKNRKLSEDEHLRIEHFGTTELYVYKNDKHGTYRLLIREPGYYVWEKEFKVTEDDLEAELNKIFDKYCRL